MIFIYLQSFINHFEGLFGTNMMTNSQLACWLSWQSAAPVLHWAWVQILYRPEFFSGLIFTTTEVVFTKCKDGFHLCVKCSILGRFILPVYNISKQIPCCCVSVQKLIKVISYTHTAQPSVLFNMFLPKFDVFCDLLLDTPIATMNPFFSCNKEQKTGNADVVCPLIEHKN